MVENSKGWWQITVTNFDNFSENRIESTCPAGFSDGDNLHLTINRLFSNMDEGRELVSLSIVNWMPGASTTTLFKGEKS